MFGTMTPNLLGQIAATFEALQGAPVEPFDPDALAAWALSQCVSPGDRKQLAALPATGFLLSCVPHDRRSALVNAVAWPEDCGMEMRVAEVMLSSHDWLIVMQRMIICYTQDACAKAHAAARGALAWGKAEEIAANASSAQGEAFKAIVEAAAKRGKAQ